jgi:hypothetical protein
MKCESEHPEYLTTTAEISEIEGYFCSIRFSGSQKPRYQDLDRKAKITVTVASGTSRNQRLYQQEVMSFEIKLASSVYLEDRYRRGVTLGQYSRSKSIRILSLADFTVNSTMDHSQLKVSKSRDSQNPSQYNLTLVVPKAQSKLFQTSLTITNLATGEKLDLPVKFDPADLSERPSQRASSTPSEWAQTSGSKQERPQEPRFQTGPKPRGEKRETPRFISYVILFFLLCLGLLLAKDTPFFNVISQSVG